VQKVCSHKHTYLQWEWALSFCGWRSSLCYCCLLPLASCHIILPHCLIATGCLWRAFSLSSFCMRAAFCLCDNRIYCFIKFVFKLPLPAVPHQLGISLSSSFSSFCSSYFSSFSSLCVWPENYAMRELFCGFNECQKLVLLANSMGSLWLKLNLPTAKQLFGLPSEWGRKRRRRGRIE